ncbi:MAG: O-antigen ligase family protein [Oscillospiraceae bacterium]|nr:O-antigen ligase family protein [Oscillospiraceae bacterium]
MAKRTTTDLSERRMVAMYSQVDKWQNRLAATLVFMIFCLQPLYLNSDRYFRLTWHKFVFFIVYMIIVLIAVAVIWLSRIFNKPRLVIREKPNLAEWAILAFGLLAIISAIISPYKKMIDIRGLPVDWKIGLNERYDGIVTQLMYIAIFFIVGRWYKPSEKQFIFFGIAAIIVAGIGILQFYGMDFLKLWPNHIPEYHKENYYDLVFRSTLGNTNIVSTYVCAAVILCGFLYIKSNSNWKYLWLAASSLNFWLMDLADADSGRVGVLAAMIFMIPYIIESTKTMGKTLTLAASWISLYSLQKLLFDVNIIHIKTVNSLLPFAIAIVVMAAAGILLDIKGKERDKDAAPRWKIGLALIVLIILAGLGGAEILGRRPADDPNPGGIIYEVREILHGNIKDEFGTNRIFVWRQAMSIYSQNPIFGSGPDTFLFVFPIEAQWTYDEPYDKAHNEYLQLLICQGILGLLSYLFFIITVAIKAIPKAFKNPLLTVVLAAFIGYLTQGFFNISLPITSQLLWVFAGMLVNKNVWASDSISE